MAFPLRLQKELRNNELIMNEWRHQVNEDMYDRCSCYWWVSKVGGNFPHLSACSLGIGFIQELDSVQVSWTLLAPVWQRALWEPHLLLVGHPGLTRTEAVPLAACAGSRLSQQVARVPAVFPP